MKKTRVLFRRKRTSSLSCGAGKVKAKKNPKTPTKKKKKKNPTTKQKNPKEKLQRRNPFSEKGKGSLLLKGGEREGRDLFFFQKKEKKEILTNRKSSLLISDRKKKRKGHPY